MFACLCVDCHCQTALLLSIASIAVAVCAWVVTLCHEMR